MTVYERFVEQRRKKGPIEGRAALLLVQLAAKLGPLSDPEEVRAKRARAVDLAEWVRSVRAAMSELGGTAATRSGRAVHPPSAERSRSPSRKGR